MPEAMVCGILVALCGPWALEPVKPLPPFRRSLRLLGGPWVVMNRVISKVSMVVITFGYSELYL